MGKATLAAIASTLALVVFAACGSAALAPATDRLATNVHKTASGAANNDVPTQGAISTAVKRGTLAKGKRRLKAGRRR